MHQWNRIRELRSTGHSITQIAAEVGLSRLTVRKWLARDNAPARPARLASFDSLQPFQDDIQVMLDRRFRGQHILDLLQQKGYSAPPRTFYRHLRALKKQLLPKLPVARFETAPGAQAQFDWSVYTLQFSAGVTRVYIFSLILGFSRYQHLYASLDCTQASVFEAIEEGFLHFQGVPLEVLVDNPKSLVTKARPNLRWNRGFLEFAGFYGFHPHACWPVRPQTKGKVERPFDLLEEYLIKGNTARTFPDFVAQLARLEVERINARVHHTTQEVPAVRFAREQPFLIPLPPKRFVGTEQLWRKVSVDCLVSYDRRRYSVPWQYAYKSVWLRIRRGSQLEIYGQDGQRIATHSLDTRPAGINLNPQHYAGLQHEASGHKAWLVGRFQKRFPRSQSFLDRLLAQYRFNATVPLRRLLALSEEYHQEELERAFEQALVYNTCTHRFVEGILQARRNEPAAETEQLPLGLETGSKTVVPAGVPEVAIARGLAGYQALIESKTGGKDD